ncbi:hypothetical protein BH23BAC4_BH23BAC4_03390 [soil metagenome]
MFLLRFCLLFAVMAAASFSAMGQVRPFDGDPAVDSFYRHVGYFHANVPQGHAMRPQVDEVLHLIARRSDRLNAESRPEYVESLLNAADETGLGRPSPEEVHAFAEAAGIQFPELVGGLEMLQGRIRYPESARRAGIQGQVWVGFLVSPNGRVIDALATRTVEPSLDRAAVRAVQRARFRPGRVYGVPTWVRFTLPITFRLT